MTGSAQYKVQIRVDIPPGCDNWVNRSHMVPTLTEAKEIIAEFNKLRLDATLTIAAHLLPRAQARIIKLDLDAGEQEVVFGPEPLLP
jgi:hypothetical protein